MQKTIIDQARDQFGQSRHPLSQGITKEPSPNSKHPGKHLTLRTKLLTLLLTLSLGSIAVVGYLSWNQSRSALRDTVFNQLTGVRSSRAYQIESLFQRLRDHIATLSEDRMVVEAMVEFNRSFRGLNNEYISSSWNETLVQYYTDEFFPRLSQNLSGELDVQNYLPSSPAAQYLQYHYIANNPNPLGEKDNLVDPGDNTAYSEVHQRYHLIFQNLIQKFGYYDLFLINPNTGDIVYSVYKETDYATNLFTGPYVRSSLGKVLQAVQENPEAGSIQIIDFQPYRPSYMAPAAFLASPIYNGPHLIGVLAIQFPVDELNQVMTGNFNWQEQGLGESGEVYLIGSDFTMRSISRFLVEDKPNYLNALRRTGLSEQTIEQIDRFDSSILLQPVETTASREALNRSGIEPTRDYRGELVLSSYAPLQIEGLKWAILAEIDLAEAYQPVRDLQFLLLVATVILILVITAITTFWVERLLFPLQYLTQQAQRASQDDLDETAKAQQEINPEFGELSSAIENLVNQIRQRSTLLRQEEQKNQALLLNLMPAPFVEKTQLNPGQPVVETIVQATVIVLRLTRLPEENVAFLAQILEQLDRLGTQYEVERVYALGNRYVAACGLTRTTLGHGQRSMQFAQKAMRLVQTLDSSVPLDLAVGMAAGSLMAGVFSGDQINYHVWGDPIDQAISLSERAAFSTILLTQTVHEQLSNSADIESEPPLELPGKQVPVWRFSHLRTDDTENELSDPNS